MSDVPQLIYKLNASPIKISASYFVDINALLLKLIWRGKGHRIANTVLQDKNKVGGLTLPDPKTYL